MKLRPKHYAISLYESLQGVSKKEIETILRNFVVLLYKNADIKFFNEIINEFTHYYNKVNNISDITVTTAFELSKDDMILVETIVKDILNKNIASNFKQDKNVLGGFVVKSEDVRIDASVKGQLESLHNS